MQEEAGERVVDVVAKHRSLRAFVERKRGIDGGLWDAAADTAETVWRVFERHLLRPGLRDRSSIVDSAIAEVVADLERLPLRQLRHVTIKLYATRAVAAIGDADDLRCFLPRVLELVACVSGQDREPWWVFSALHALKLAKWHTWPLDERRAIADCLAATWRVSRFLLPRGEPVPYHFTLDALADFLAARPDLIPQDVVDSTSNWLADHRVARRVEFLHSPPMRTGAT